MSKNSLQNYSFFRRWFRFAACESGRLTFFGFSLIFVLTSLLTFGLALKTAFSAGVNNPATTKIHVNTGKLKINGTLNNDGEVQTSSGTIGVTEDWDNRDGTYDSNNGTVELYGSSGTQLIYSTGTGAGKLFYNLSHTGASTAQAQNSDLNLDGSFSNTAGMFDVNGYDMTVAKNWNNSAAFSPGTQTVTFDGTGQGAAAGQYVTGSTTFFNFTKSVSGATPETIYFDANTGAEQNVTGTLTLLGTSQTSRLEIRSNIDGTRAKLNLNTGGIQAIDYVDVKDSHASGLTLVAHTPNSYDSGNTLNWIFGEATVRWDGDQDSDWNNPYNWDLGFVPTAQDKAIIQGSATNMPDLSTYGSADLTLNNLEIESGATMEAAGVNITLTSQLTVASGGSLTMSSGDLTMDTLDNEGSIYLIGNEQVDINTIDPDSGTFYLTGNGDGNSDTYTLDDINTDDFYNLVIAATDSNDVFQTQAGLSILGDLTVTSGTLDIGTGAAPLSVDGDVIVNGGTLTATTTDSASVDIGGDLNIQSGIFTAPDSSESFTLAGDFHHDAGGAFNHSSGTLVLDGGDQAIYGSTTFFKLQKTVTSDALLTFEAGETQTIPDGGDLTMTGTSGATLSILSTSSTQANIEFQDGATQTLEYLYVENHNASDLTLVARNSTQGSNVTNWSFGVSTLTWQGDISDNWETQGNWDLGLVPAAGDTVIVPDTAGDDPTFYDHVDIAELTVASGAVVTVNGFDFMITGDLFNSGNIKLDGSETGNISIANPNATSGTFTYIGNNDGTEDTFTIKQFGNPGDVDYYNLVIEDEHSTNPDVFITDADLNIANNLTVINGTLDLDNDATNVDGVLTVEGGLLDALEANLDANGNISITGGELIAPGPGLSFTVADDFSHTAGDFTHSGGTVSFDTTAEALISGDTVFHTIYSREAGKVLKFEDGSKQTVTGTFDFRGTENNEISLLSQTDGQQWEIDVPTTDQNGIFLQVKDSAALTNTITCFNCQDLGNNNSNWIFMLLYITVPGENRAIDQQPTVIGITGANQVVDIKGYVSGVLTTVGTVTSDANGAFRLELPVSLDLGSNRLIPYVGSMQGPDVPGLTVVAAPTTDQVPTITSHNNGDRVNGATPTIGGVGLANQTATVVGSDFLGNLLLTDVGIGTVDANGDYTVTLTTPLPKALNYISVTVNGVASDILEIKLTDPYGVVFDSTTNTLIKDAVVSLFRSSDNQLATVADGDLDSTDVNPLTTGADGVYSFITADKDYYITVNAAGFDYPSGKTSFPSDRSIVTGSKGEIFTVAGAVIEMDHPMDANGQILRVEKDANKKEVKIGEVVTYTVTIENRTTNDVADVYLKDVIPPGFKYLEGRVKLDGQIISDPAGNRPLDFALGTIQGGQTKTLKYQLVVGSGVSTGSYENKAYACYSNGQLLSNFATEEVKVVMDPLFDLGTLIGKVFFDKNENGVQDVPEYAHLDREIYMERPVPNARIAMEDGTVVTTDENGRFSIPGIMPGRHVLRLDERSLPEGSYLTTDKAVVVDVTKGLLVKVNFGVNLDYERSQDKDQQFFTGKVNVVQEPSRASPRMFVDLFGGSIPVYEDVFVKDAEFRIFTNYAPFIKMWRLEILDKDTHKSIRVFEGNSLNIHDPVFWDGLDAAGNHIRLDREYVYTVYAEDEKGNYDETALVPITFNVFEKEKELTAYQEDREENRVEEYRQWVKESAVKNNLLAQTIIIDGETVKINNISARLQSVVVMKDHQLVAELPVPGRSGLTPQEARDGKAQEQKQAMEVILPKGDYEILVQEGAGFTESAGEPVPLKDSAASESAPTVTEEFIGQPSQLYTKQIRVGEDYLFFVGMGDAKIGYAFNTGNIEPIQSSDDFRNGFYSEGTAAYYLKGKIKGKYLITSSFDMKREQKELFKDLDEDEYYPIYGDSSTIDHDATDTQGPLYLMLEWDKSSVQWSSYSVGFEDTEFAKYSRSLYGGKISYESLSTTPHGESRSKLIAFSATEKQRSAHNEFLATGGSVYYLKHKDVLADTDQVKIEIRDKVTGLVLSSQEMKEGADYEMDYDSGRILFWQPVSMMMESSSIINNSLLDGNPVYVMVDYEYDVKDKYDEATYGGRVRQAVTDNVLVGGTYVSETQDSETYELRGMDVTVHLGDKATLKAEYAETEADTIGTYISTDGGLSFTEIETANDAWGRAYGMTFDAKLFDRVGMGAYYKWVDNDFSTAATTAQQGKEVTGAKLVYDFTDTTRLSLSHDIQRLINEGNAQSKTQTGGSSTATTLMQMVHEGRKLTLTGEYQRQDTDGEIADTLAMQADYSLTDRLSFSVKRQMSLQGTEGSQTVFGVTATPTDQITLTAEETIGEDGTATSLGVKASMNEKFALTGEYSLATDTSGYRTGTTSIGVEATPTEKSKIAASIGLAQSSDGTKDAAMSITGTSEMMKGTTLDGSIALTGAGESRRVTAQIGSSSDVGFEMAVNDQTKVKTNVALSSDSAGDYTSHVTIGGETQMDEKTKTTTEVDYTDSAADGRVTSYTFGTEKQLTEELKVVSSKTFGDKGADGTEQDQTYSIIREKNGKKLEGYFTKTYADEATQQTRSNIFGLTGDINDKWAVTGSYEKGTVQNLDGTETSRDALAVALGFVDKDEKTGRSLESSTKLEYRIDEGDEDTQQYLFYHAAKGQVNDALSLFTKAEFSKTRNLSSGFTSAQYKEMMIGAAYRPVMNDRLNLLARYTFLEDRSPESQEDSPSVQYESAHVVAAEAIYDLTPEWQLSEKFAYRVATEKVEDFDFNRTHTWLMVNRLNYKFDKDWGVGAEFRILSQQEAQDMKRGVLVEITRRMGEFAQLGVGYDFTDFTDDLTDLSYTTQGPFVRMTGKFYDRTPEEAERARWRYLEEKINRWAWIMVEQELQRDGSAIMSELNDFYVMARVAFENKKYEQAQKLYKDIITAGQMMFLEAAEYIRERIHHEDQLKEMKALADQYFKNGQYDKAKKILQKILEEAGDSR